MTWAAIPPDQFSWLGCRAAEFRILKSVSQYGSLSPALRRRSLNTFGHRLSEQWKTPFGSTVALLQF